MSWSKYPEVARLGVCQLPTQNRGGGRRADILKGNDGAQRPSGRAQVIFIKSIVLNLLQPTGRQATEPHSCVLWLSPPS